MMNTQHNDSSAEHTSTISAHSRADHRSQQEQNPSISVPKQHTTEHDLFEKDRNEQCPVK